MLCNWTAPKEKSCNIRPFRDIFFTLLKTVETISKNRFALQSNKEPGTLGRVLCTILFAFVYQKNTQTGLIKDNLLTVC